VGPELARSNYPFVGPGYPTPEILMLSLFGLLVAASIPMGVRRDFGVRHSVGCQIDNAPPERK
jgi:hypothetical protein